RDVDVDVGLVERHREQLQVPGIAEVCRDDPQVRERRRRGVEPDRTGEVDPDALASGLPGADSARSGVEERDEAQLLALFVQGPVLFLVWCERLERRMELDALEPELRDAVELRHRAVALERVDAAEPDER